MGHVSGTRGDTPLKATRTEWIETFRSRSRCDLRSGWRRSDALERTPFIFESWGKNNRPDWADRGLLIWPRGRAWLRLEQTVVRPEAWPDASHHRARLCLSWWAESARLWVDGVLVHQGDLFDTACRWMLPEAFLAGQVLRIQLELCSPLHDDGALISSWLDLEPNRPGEDPAGVLLPEALQLHLEAGGDLPLGWEQMDPNSDAALKAVEQQLMAQPTPQGAVHWFGHAHLDLAWLWPVADTWQAAERTFRSALALMKRWPDLRFAHSTPALYSWMEQHRPELFSAIRRASRAGRWEPINGPWVETDCVLVSTASLWQQFAIGQAYSRETFPEWRHHLAWLPDSFGFAAGLPAVAQATGVRWFCTHKLAWNASNPFPHRLFRWRSRGGGSVMSLMLPPIGRRGDPLDILKEQRQWQQCSGVSELLWIPGVGDHGGGPTEEMLAQMQLWDPEPSALPRQAGSLRQYLDRLEPMAGQLPVWRDELYLELHRGCATSRPDQKRHNRSLERLLRENDTVAALLAFAGRPSVGRDWRPLLFQQFHDILPGTSIPEVFDQAEPIWRRARRQARHQRDEGLRQLLGVDSGSGDSTTWLWMGWQPLARWSPLLKLPLGTWHADGAALPQQPSVQGGTWVQLPQQRGICSVALSDGPADSGVMAPRHPVSVVQVSPEIWRVSNGLVEFECSSLGLLQLRDARGIDQFSAPLRPCRYRDRGEFWDAWDIAAEYRRHPLELEHVGAVQLLESGPLVAQMVVNYRLGASRMRLDLRLKADCPWLELIVSVDWCQRHELLRLDIPLASAAVRLAADTSGGVIERPAHPQTPREQERWEVPAISWLASQAKAPGGGIAVLLDGPQGVDGATDRLGISLLRSATWPDPSADQGQQRMRLALMPFQDSWAHAAVPQAAVAFREPGWHGPIGTGHHHASMGTHCWLPAIPSRLCPIALRPDANGVVLQLLNPGASRCRWQLGEGWKVGRSVATDDWTELAPGELVELRLAQSS